MHDIMRSHDVGLNVTNYGATIHSNVDPFLHMKNGVIIKECLSVYTFSTTF
jgi:hypothetical protein